MIEGSLAQIAGASPRAFLQRTSKSSSPRRPLAFVAHLMGPSLSASLYGSKRARASLAYPRLVTYLHLPTDLDTEPLCKEDGICIGTPGWPVAGGIGA
jgi:hypothetical protein